MKTETLNKVVEYCKHYLVDRMDDVKKSLKANTMGEVVQEWYATFINDLESEDKLERPIRAAHFLNIKPLLDLSCAKMALMIKARIPDEVDTTAAIALVVCRRAMVKGPAASRAAIAKHRKSIDPELAKALETVGSYTNEVCLLDCSPLPPQSTVVFLCWPLPS